VLYIIIIIYLRITANWAIVYFVVASSSPLCEQALLSSDQKYHAIRRGYTCTAVATDRGCSVALLLCRYVVGSHHCAKIYCKEYFVRVFHTDRSSSFVINNCTYPILEFLPPNRFVAAFLRVVLRTHTQCLPVLTVLTHFGRLATVQRRLLRDKRHSLLVQIIPLDYSPSMSRSTFG
jgi:hypothetical protein